MNDEFYQIALGLRNGDGNKLADLIIERNRLKDVLRQVVDVFITKESYPDWKDDEDEPNDEFIRLATIETQARELIK